MVGIYANAMANTANWFLDHVGFFCTVAHLHARTAATIDAVLFLFTWEVDLVSEPYSQWWGSVSLLKYRALETARGLLVCYWLLRWCEQTSRDLAVSPTGSLPKP